jgi:glucose/arabinose dehydrogenase/PKD repeat protein
MEGTRRELPRAARRAAAFLAALTVVAGTWAARAEAITVPPGFDDQFVTTVTRATALAFTPDGRMLAPAKDGTFHVVRPDAAPQVALDIRQKTCSDSERGVLGTAVDPLFSENRFVYLYYTFKKFGVCDSNTPTAPVNRVSRFVLPDTDVIDPATETVLIDNIPSPDGIHNAGDLGFGQDGYLYVSVGDGGCDFRGDSGCYLLNDAARDLGALSGKLLRVTRDGASPPGNPFMTGPNDSCRLTGFTNANKRCTEIYASGLRNPFRFATDPGSTRFNINDVGAAKWEEIDRAAPGADFGWNVREGPCVRDSRTNCGPPPAGMTNPIHSYDHLSGCTSITAGAFVPGGAWPAEKDGAYVYGDLVCGKLFELVEQPGGAVSVQEFGTEMGLLIDAAFGPHGTTQALYYISWGQYPNDSIRRISYVGDANRSPEAIADATPSSGAVPLTVQFDGGESTDADGDPLTYDWDFGDGSAPASGASVSHTYTEAGIFTATLSVSDGRGGEDTATVRIRPGNEPPAVTVSSPVEGQRFAVGETIALTGFASDPEDGPLPGSALSWMVVRHHDTHTHPFLPPTAGEHVDIEGPTPEDIHATATSYLEVTLTATDSDGLSTTVRRDLLPRTVDLTFATEPPGVSLEVAGSPVVGPTTVTSWDGWRIPVVAPDQAEAGGSGVTFVSWSDEGARAHDITTPAAAATYTAQFTDSYARPQGATPARFSLVVAYPSCDTPDRVHGPPLEYASCADPEPESRHLTTGTPDANGQGANLVGRVRLAVRPGDPATPADEADVIFVVELSDVRESPSLADYTGELEANVGLRITDTLNGSETIEAGTLTDQALRATVPCAGTVSTQVGSRCELSTTLEALIPGVAVERARAIWEMDQVTVNDGGSDGDADTSGDNTLFARPGIFIP